MRCKGVDPLDLLDGRWATFPELYTRLHARTGVKVTDPEQNAPRLGAMMAVLVAQGMAEVYCDRGDLSRWRKAA